VIVGHDHARYPSPSEARFAVLQALIVAGCSDKVIAAVMLDNRFGISAKPRQEGLTWVAGEIGRARAKSNAWIVG
jgi:hypothetical protein